MLACALFAIDPAAGGVVLRGAPGAARDAWLEALGALLPEGAPTLRIPAGIADDRLIGGLDIAATLSLGRPVVEAGAIAKADGGVLILTMAERASAGLGARLAGALDAQAITIQRDGFAVALPARFGLVMLDESIGEDERPPAALGRAHGHVSGSFVCSLQRARSAVVCSARDRCGARRPRRRRNAGQGRRKPCRRRRRHGRSIFARAAFRAAPRASALRAAGRENPRSRRPSDRRRPRLGPARDAGARQRAGRGRGPGRAAAA